MFLFHLRPWHSLALSAVVPSASCLFCFYLSVCIGSPYRIAWGSPGDGKGGSPEAA